CLEPISTPQIAASPPSDTRVMTWEAINSSRVGYHISSGGVLPMRCMNVSGNAAERYTPIMSCVIDLWVSASRPGKLGWWNPILALGVAARSLPERKTYGQALTHVFST